MSARRGKRKADSDIGFDQRWAIVAKIMLYTDVSSGKLQNGATSKIAKEHGVSNTTGHNIQQIYTSQIAQGVLIPDLRAKREGQCGRPSNLTDDIKKKIKALNKKTGQTLTIEQLCVEFEKKHYRIPKTTFN